MITNTIYTQTLLKIHRHTDSVMTSYHGLNVNNIVYSFNIHFVFLFDILIFVGLLLSRKTMGCAPIIYPSGLLQRLLWLYNPIFEPHTDIVATFEGLHIWLSGFFCHMLLASLFSSHCYRIRLSLVLTHIPIAVLQLLRSAAWVSQFAGFILPVFMLRLQTYLNWMIGLHVSLVPVASSLYRVPLRILPSCIRLTWPGQRRRLWDCRANNLGIPAFAKTSLLEMRSCWARRLYSRPYWFSWYG